MALLFGEVDTETLPPDDDFFGYPVPAVKTVSLYALL